MNKKLLSLSFIILLLACNSPHPRKEQTIKSPIDSLMDLVMHGHDQGMGRIGRVEKAAQELSRKIDSIQQSKNINRELLISWKSIKKNLESADSSMNRWMDSFDMEMEGMDSLHKIQYLQSNEKTVNNIADSLKIALDSAEILLNKK